MSAGILIVSVRGRIGTEDQVPRFKADLVIEMRFVDSIPHRDIETVPVFLFPERIVPEIDLELF